MLDPVRQKFALDPDIQSIRKRAYPVEEGERKTHTRWRDKCQTGSGGSQQCQERVWELWAVHRLVGQLMFHDLMLELGE